MKHKVYVYILLVALLAGSCGLRDVNFHAASINCEGCPKVPLSGVNATVDYPVSATYHTIETAGVLSIIYTDSVSAVRLVVDSALVPYFKMRDVKGALKLSLDSLSVSDSFNVVVYVPQSPMLTNVKLSGVCSFESRVPVTAGQFELEADGVSAFDCRFEMPEGTLRMDISGVSSVKASGNVAKADIEMGGVGSLEAADMTIKSCDIDINGTSTAQIACLDDLRADVSGMSDLVATAATVDRCTLDLSGTSSTDIACGGHLKADVQGMSRLTFSGPCTTEIEQSKLSSVSKENK